jgi:hypothetical protein
MKERIYKPRNIILDKITDWNKENMANCNKCIHCWKCTYAFQGGRECSSFKKRAGIR